MIERYALLFSTTLKVEVVRIVASQRSRTLSGILMLLVHIPSLLNIARSQLATDTNLALFEKAFGVKFPHSM